MVAYATTLRYQPSHRVFKTFPKLEKIIKCVNSSPQKICPNLKTHNFFQADFDTFKKIDLIEEVSSECEIVLATSNN